MGYTHYWRRAKELDAAKWAAFVKDVDALYRTSEAVGIKLGDGHGERSPIADEDVIAFNGSSTCGHAKNESIVIPWPTLTAAGVGGNDEAVAGRWFAGATLDTRTCNGDCSYESVVIERAIHPAAWQEPDAETGLYFECCKTAFRPYDVTVTAVLIAAQHHFGADHFTISSDGEDQHWNDGRAMCMVACGYGSEFTLREVPA